MTVLLPHLEKSDDSTRVGCHPALNGCFITVSDRCREHPAAVRARCRGAMSKPTKRDSETGIHRCAIFSEERQLSNFCLFGKYWFHPLQQVSHQFLAQSDVAKMHQRGEEAIYNQIPSWKQKRSGDSSSHVSGEVYGSWPSGPLDGQPKLGNVW